MVDDLSRLGAQVVRDGDGPHRGIDVERQRREAITGGLAHPFDLLPRCLERQRPRVDGDARRDSWCQADDVGLTSGQRERATATATDEQRRVRTLDGGWSWLVVGDRVVLAGEAERLARKDLFEDRDGFGQPCLAYRRGVEAEADGVVLRPVPAGA